MKIEQTNPQTDTTITVEVIPVEGSVYVSLSADAESQTVATLTTNEAERLAASLHCVLNHTTIPQYLTWVTNAPKSDGVTINLFGTCSRAAAKLLSHTLNTVLGLNYRSFRIHLSQEAAAASLSA